jgi:signal transduction histidine kinase
MLSNPTKPPPTPRLIDEVLATLAHELRNPLNTIRFALDLHADDGDPAARRALTMATQQARRAVRIIDDLFDLCAGSRGRLTLRKDVAELAEVVARATDATAHLLAARGHRLTVSLPAEPGAGGGSVLRAGYQTDQGRLSMPPCRYVPCRAAERWVSQ